MRILVDANVPMSEQTFGRHGQLVRFDGRSLSAEDLCDADALIVRSTTQVNASLLKSYQPAFIGTCTAGFDHIDTTLLKQNQLHWTHAAGCNAQSVVDYVFCCIASLQPSVLYKTKTQNLTQSTIGIVGCGHVGNLLRVYALKLGFEVRVFDPFLDSAKIAQLTDLSTVMKSNVVCLHTPLTQSGHYPSKAMIGLKQLQQLPTNALLIQAGRGGVLQESAVLQLFNERKDVHFAIDVWENEPSVTPELLALTNIGSVHIAGYASAAKERGTWQIYKQFCDFFELSYAALNSTPKSYSQQLQCIETSPVFTQMVGDAVDSNSSLAEALLNAYNPMNDHHLMQQALNSALDRKTAFDSLRKNYPARAELAEILLKYC